MNKLKILVTGAKGQLGQELFHLTKSDTNQWIFTDIEELDITNDRKVKNFFTSNKFDYCANFAAYTAVDKAEIEKDLSFKINVEGVSNIIEGCKINNTTMIHISTDYIFNGRNNKPYTEEDTADPLSVYAKTKAEGELRIISSSINYCIIRTSWLYSTFGNNFVKTILRLAKEKNIISVVYDQIGSPTYAKYLAKTIIHIINEIKNKEIKEIYHFANSGVASWYDVAQEIITYFNLPCIVKPILSEEYPSLAQRPHYSVLNTSKIKKDFNIDIIYWKHALYECLDNLKKLQGL